MRRHAVVLAILAIRPLGAANAEVTGCNVISVLPFSIEQTGIWCLTADLSLSKKNGKAIVIKKADVTLDLNGHVVSGLGAGVDTNAIGIYVYDRRGVTIRNGVVRGFSTGIQFAGGPSAGTSLVESMQIDRSRRVGVDLQGNGAVFRNNQVLNTGDGSAPLTNVIAIRVTSSQAVMINDNALSFTGAGGTSGYGIVINDSDLIEVRGNSLQSTSSYGMSIGTSTNVTISGNRVLNGTVVGAGGIVASGTGINCYSNIVARFGNPLSGCTATSGNLTP